MKSNQNNKKLILKINSNSIDNEDVDCLYI